MLTLHCYTASIQFLAIVLAGANKLRRLRFRFNCDIMKLFV